MYTVDVNVHYFVLFVAALATLLLSCGSEVAARPEAAWMHALPDDLPPEGDLMVRPEERRAPALSLRLPWRNQSAFLGFGVIHLWARPSRDHVRVSAIIDAPASGRRWQCADVILRFGHGEDRLPAEYVGRPMRSGGSYDALRLRIGIHQLRAMARAREARADVCGDELVLTPAQQRTLAWFVEWFDYLATSRQADDMPYFRDVGPSPSLPSDGLSRRRRPQSS